MVAPRLVVGGMLSLLLCAGCTRRVYFSESIRDGLELGAGAPGEQDPEAGSGLQYFASHRILLQREISSRNEKITGGRIVVRKGRLLEQVLIRRGTPGIAIDWGEDWVAVSFEKGSQLIFERSDPADGSGPHPPPDLQGLAGPRNVYRIRTQSAESGPSTVRFDGHDWELVSSHGRATLQVKRNALGSKKRRRRVLRGRRL